MYIRPIGLQEENYRHIKRKTTFKIQIEIISKINLRDIQTSVNSLLTA